MSPRTAAGRPRTADAAELLRWLRQLTGCPPVTHAIVTRCDAPSHGGDTTWCYVEADPAAGVARRRCLACARVTPVLDSAEHWTHPPMWSCPQCSQSIAEVAAGVHAPDGTAEWLVLAARCVACGTTAGLTDLLLDGALPVDEVLVRV